MKNDVKALVAAAIFLTLMFSAVSFDLRAIGAGGSVMRVFGCGAQSQRGCWEGAPQGGEDMAGVANVLFRDDVLPFEILSLVLLVALVAAIFMARLESPAEEGGDVE
ncbi:MAG: NADH-quinone oxidoreductase subunit J [Halobacteriales archaeon]|nr:NADH-quinone oxidoreductase subunit J [Halobacteriales archaeon]